MTEKRTYAQDTRVSIGKSKQDIETLVVGKYGADAFGTFVDNGALNCFFRLRGRNIRFTMPEPERPQQKRACWRALLLTIKAKLTSWDAGIETFENAFLAQTVMATGETVGEYAQPVLERHYSGEHDVPLLPSPSND